MTPTRTLVAKAPGCAKAAYHAGKVPAELTNRLGIAIAQRTYKAYREMLASSRFQRAANAGARAQRDARRGN